MPRLCDMINGEKACVTKLYADCSMRRRFMDMGLVSGTEVECIGHSPLGDPAAYLIRGAVIAIRAADAHGVEVNA